MPLPIDMMEIHMSSSKKKALPECDFRGFLPDLESTRFTTMHNQNARQYAESFKQGQRPPWLYALWQHWCGLLKEPFKGVTNDGNIRPDLFTLQDEDVPIQTIVEATGFFISTLDDIEERKVLYHIDSPEWRTWSNPEFLLSDKGVRLDEVTEQTREAALAILKTTLSPEGYAKAIGAMRINGFLGELIDAQAVCNEYSYNFAIFGIPSTTEPWGFSFYGHHLCLNIFFHRSQMVISPWFTGAEPNEIDSGPYQGTTILRREERLGLELMQSLSTSQRAKAHVFKHMKDPIMPPGRWNRDDQRHLCGAYRDNRIIPYEGITISTMTTSQVCLVEQILEEYLLYLPTKSRQAQLDMIKNYFHETYFCWIGGFTDDDAFYYRIQSPVIIAEFDHHSGVFLTNDQPARFHIHTLLRTPNGGDYGKALTALVPGKEQLFICD